MSNISTGTDDSFQTCCSSIFENSHESENGSLHDALNSRVFLIPSSINDMWLLEQVNKFKLMNSKVESNLKEGYVTENDDILKDDGYDYSRFAVDEYDSNLTKSFKLSDVVKSKLSSDEKQRNNQLFDEDSYIINELVSELSLDPLENESEEQSITLTQCEIEEIKDLLSQDY
ncbi:hypothetical protein RS030_243628 [Cryptosporidium xiaoi]|uniref:Uncharacterized protein n=1 Tax=Cryptosporidium xiaoi TaxID=659607 RepID=A0AAV9XXM2_9CRYT